MRDRFVRLSVPESAHPLVRHLFDEMAAQRCALTDMAERSGVNKNTLKDWRTRTVPTVASLEACFNVLGFTLKPTKVKP